MVSKGVFQTFQQIVHVAFGAANQPLASFILVQVSET